VLSIVMLAAAPSLGVMATNTRIRSTAESLQNALRLAQAEAVRRNRQVVFVLTNDTPSLAATPADNGLNWLVRALPLLPSSGTVDDSSTLLVQRGVLVAPGNVSVTAVAQTCFNSLGRQTGNATLYTGAKTSFQANCSVGTSAQVFDIASAATDLRLRVQVYMGGRVRMCSPNSSSSSPESCL
jgi:type IV fimbrial biogenesis protein FimT